jgi:hypothetical protein
MLCRQKMSRASTWPSRVHFATFAVSQKFSAGTGAHGFLRGGHRLQEFRAIKHSYAFKGWKKYNSNCRRAHNMAATSKRSSCFEMAMAALPYPTRKGAVELNSAKDIPICMVDSPLL